MTALASLPPGQVVATLAARRVAREEHAAQLLEDDRVIAELELLAELDSEAVTLPTRRRLPAATATHAQRGGRRPHIELAWPAPPVDDSIRLAHIRLLMHGRAA